MLVFLFVVIQVALGLLGHSLSIAGRLHGLNALALFAAALNIAPSSGCLGQPSRGAGQGNRVGLST